MNLNIRYDAPKEVWDKVPMIYKQLEGWIGFGQDENKGQNGIPYWYSFNENEKHISASVEPSGLFFCANMNDGEWEIWKQNMKNIATKELGYQMGEIELGEVDF